MGRTARDKERAENPVVAPPEPPVTVSPDGSTYTVNGNSVEAAALPQARRLKLESMAVPEPAAPVSGDIPDLQLGTQEAPAVAGAPQIVPEDQRVNPFQQQAQQPAMPAGPPGPAMVRVRNTTQSVEGMDPKSKAKLLKDQEKLEKRTTEYLRSKAETESDRYAIQANAAVRRKEISERSSAEMRDLDDRMKGVFDESQQRVAAARAEAAQMREKGHDFWADKTTGQRIAAGIGAIFGGALAGLKGGPNEFMSFLEREMAREDAAHERRIAGKEKEASDAIDYYQMARARTNDEREAKLFARDMQYQAAEDDLQRYMANLDSESATYLQMQEGLLAIQEKRMGLQAELADRQRINSATKVVPNPAHKQWAQQQAAMGEMAAKEIPGTAVTNDAVFYGLKDGAHEKAREQSIAWNKLLSSAQRLKALRDKHGAELMTSPAAAEAKQLVMGMAANASVARGQGAMTDDEYNRFASNAGDLNWAMSNILPGYDFQKNSTEGLERVIVREGNQSLRGYGLGLEGTVTDANGKRVADGAAPRLRGAKGGAAK